MDKSVRVKDLEFLGGGFVRGELLNVTLKGSEFTGTAYFNNQQADLVIRIKPDGQAIILGPIDQSENSVKAYTELTAFLEEKKQDVSTGYRARLHQRTTAICALTILMGIITAVMIYSIILYHTTNNSNHLYMIAAEIALLATTSIKRKQAKRF